MRGAGCWDPAGRPRPPGFLCAFSHHPGSKTAPWRRLKEQTRVVRAEMWRQRTPREHEGLRRARACACVRARACVRVCACAYVVGVGGATGAGSLPPSPPREPAAPTPRSQTPRPQNWEKSSFRVSRPRCGAPLGQPQDADRRAGLRLPGPALLAQPHVFPDNCSTLTSSPRMKPLI